MNAREAAEKIARLRMSLNSPADIEPIVQSAIDSVVEKLKNKLEEIVEIEGCDKGVIYKSWESPTHYDESLRCQVYDHENFSELGDALIELHEMMGSFHDG